MNTILILIDSLNRHALSAHNPESTIQTPNLDNFAAKSRRFDNHFVGSLPCIPARREIFTGRKEFLWRPWGPLEHWDHKLPELLALAGYRTAIVTDHYHYWEHTVSGYLQHFQSLELIRGHEADKWKSLPANDEKMPRWVEIIEEYRGKEARQYYANVRDFKSEEDFFPAKVFSGAADWLKENAQNSAFYLQIESYDVHEPWHVPEPYASMYGDPELINQYNIFPPYHHPDRLRRFMSHTSEEELAFIRSQYAAKVTMVDRWLGEVFTELDRQGLWQDTCVIIASDHGHDIGERGMLGKQFPHYDSHAHIPLFVWHPEYGKVDEPVKALTTTVDLFATILDTMDCAVPEHLHSKSLVPLLRRETDAIRDAHIYGTFGQGICITNGEWTLFKSPVRTDNLFMYSTILYQSLLYKERLQPPVEFDMFVPQVAFPQWKIPQSFPQWSDTDFLYHRQSDPQLEHNLWDEEPQVRDMMLELVKELMMQEGSPPEQFERLGL